MLDNFDINLKYSINGSKKVKVLSDLQNEDITINTDVADTNRLVLTLVPNGSVKVVSLEVHYHYDYLPRFKQYQRIFCNGYQTWTESKEYFPDEHIPVTKKAVPDGDYAFTTTSKEPGCFHSISYTYLRNNDEIELLASMNESTGFTIFYHDVVGKSINVNKDLEGVTIDKPYEIMNIARYVGEYNAMFDKWFADMNIPKPRRKRATGYTTWYNYYNKIDENIVLRDLESLASLDTKVDIFQIDDGYQANIGDWTTIKPTFGGMDSMADAIHEKNMLAGLWLAPFAVSPKSEVYKAHPDWLIKDAKGKPVQAGFNWGGPFYSLDIYNDDVRAHLSEVFGTILRNWGYDMLKLDFLYQVAIVPYNNKTRGEIMTDAMNLLRDLAGDALILGCGVPLFPAFGKVDFCRIGPDMDLKWSTKFSYREQVSAIAAVNNAIFRRHLDGRAFVNDPDVFLLRSNNIKLNENQRAIIANVNMLFGSLLFTSDNVASYNKQWQIDLLYEVFREKRIRIMGAEYVTSNILHIKCYADNVPIMITIDMKKGIMLKQEVDPSELKVTNIDSKLSARGGNDYEHALSSEFDNYDDFQFDRKLSAEEQAEVDKERAKAEEIRQAKINEIMEQRKAERDAIRAEKEAERAAQQAEYEKKQAEYQEKLAEYERQKAEYEQQQAAKKAEAEAKRKAEEERLKAEAEAKRKAAEEAAKKKAEEEEAKKKAEEEAKKAEEAKAPSPATPAPATPAKKPAAAKPATPAKKPAAAKPATPAKKPAAAKPATPAKKPAAAKPATPDKAE